MDYLCRSHVTIQRGQHQGVDARGSSSRVDIITSIQQIAYGGVVAVMRGNLSTTVSGGFVYTRDICTMVS